MATPLDADADDDDHTSRALGMSAQRFDQVTNRIDSHLETLQWRGQRATRTKASVQRLVGQMNRQADALQDASRLVSRLQQEIALAREEKRREELRRARERASRSGVEAAVGAAGALLGGLF